MYLADINLLIQKESRIAFMTQEVTTVISNILIKRYGWGISYAEIIKWYN